MLQQRRQSGMARVEHVTVSDRMQPGRRACSFRKWIACSGISLFLVWSLVEPAYSRSPTETKRSVQAVRFENPPTIDGRPDDPVWLAAESSEGFIQFEPRHGEAASMDSGFKVGFDEEAVYVLAVFSDPRPDQMAASITRRDGELGEDDAVVVLLDTYHDNING